MLSAAHVLAMDAKNLLDVVDSVRIRYPDLFNVESALCLAAQQQQQYETDDERYLKESDDNDVEQINTDNPFQHSNSSSTTAGPVNFNEDYMEQQTYQNLCKSSEPPPPPFTADEIYVNQIEPIQTTEGIYDNECIVNAQLKNLNIDATIANSFANTSTTINHTNKIIAPVSSTKPPLAAKPGRCLTFPVLTLQLSRCGLNDIAYAFVISVKSSNLQQKIKALNNAGLSVSAVEKFIPPSANFEHDEPLKIIENDSDLYFNTKPME